MIGQIVGHYRILEKIGTGGMGEVYRAHDQRLDRDVALKLVRRSSNDNPDHLRRFELEARAAAALNHPNIVAVYDVGVENGVPYIVSELLEGETLRQRLSRGLLPLSQASDYALHIVHGLIAAHDRRIIHRDLKPENLFITRDGRVKILDFGVAKLQSGNSEPLENVDTVTKAGAIVGTVAYMSPEQLRGKPVDSRSDIFSVGAILYEMLTGNRAFRGESDADTMMAVLREEPPELSLEQAQIPASVRSLVRHCLEKEPENRFQSAKDLAFALGTISGSSSYKVRLEHKPGTRTGKAIPWAIAALLAVGLGLLLRSRAEVRPPNYRRLTFEHGTVYSARFAPNGENILYTAAWNGSPPQVFATVGNSLLAQPLNLIDAKLLGVSRSTELALLMHGIRGAHLETEQGVLARAPLAGGSPREVLTNVHWADWDANGELAVVHEVDGHSQLEYPAGHALYRSPGWISHIRFSPQGDKIAFMDHPVSWDDRGTVCVTDRAGHITILSKEWESEDGLAWRADGSEIWFTAVEKGTNRDLLAVNLSGKIRTLLDLPSSLTLQDVASDGRVLVSLNTERLAMAATRDKRDEVDLSWHDWDIAKGVSADGRQVLFEDASEAAGNHYTVAIRDLDGSPPIRLGEGSAGGLSPDGKWAISIFAGDPPRVELLPVGAGQPRPVSVTGLEHIQNGTSRFLADGAHITINGNEPGHDIRCYIVDLQGGKPRPATPEGITGIEVSPDGKYVLVGHGTSEVALYPLDGGPRRLIPSLDPDFRPIRWSKDSAALYGYRSGEIPAKIYKVDIATGKKTVLYELLLHEPAGVVNMAPVVIDRDATRVAYSYYQVLSVLYVVSGLQ